ncbi:hypothetical protein AYI70_g9256 [Smittium culicis]|uniref:Uncharacterized protein n=1 Tax=Smittium culicis TaxID=133412 RepID=A0A1R1XC93_9FUNG|nr:hypothetical protein AYI70_g9256 [Smittium culicis]
MNLLLNNKKDDFIDIDLMDLNGSPFNSNEHLYKKNNTSNLKSTKNNVEDLSEDETVTSTATESSENYPNFLHSLDYLNYKIFKELSDITNTKFSNKFEIQNKSSFSENFSQSSESLFEDDSIQKKFREYSNDILDNRFDYDLSTGTRLGTRSSIDFFPPLAANRSFNQFQNKKTKNFDVYKGYHIKKMKIFKKRSAIKAKNSIRFSPEVNIDFYPNSNPSPDTASNNPYLNLKNFLKSTTSWPSFPFKRKIIKSKIFKSSSQNIYRNKPIIDLSINSYPFLSRNIIYFAHYLKVSDYLNDSNFKFYLLCLSFFLSCILWVLVSHKL